MKLCNKCKISKPYSEFNKKSDTKDGLYPSCRECRKLLQKNYYEENKNNIQEYQKNYYKNNSEKVKKREKKRREENPELFKIYELNRRENRKKYLNQYFYNRRNADDLFKMSHNVREKFNKFIKNKSKSTEKIIGLTFDGLKEYLENQFKDNMSWDNYGEWHIDHIIPLSLAKTEEDVYKLCHYINLQPLWAEENLKKSNKII